MSQIISRRLQKIIGGAIKFQQRYCMSAILLEVYFITDAVLVTMWIFPNFKLCTFIGILYFMSKQGALSTIFKNLPENWFPLLNVVGWSLRLASCFYLNKSCKWGLSEVFFKKNFAKFLEYLKKDIYDGEQFNSFATSRVVNDLLNNKSCS